MKRYTGRQLALFFYGFDAILLLVVIFLFLPFSRKNKAETHRDYFLSPQDVQSVTVIKIRDCSTGNRVVLSKKGTVWTGTDSYSNETLNWPCPQGKVEKFLDLASQKHQWTLKAEKVSSWKNLGVDKRDCIEVDFVSSDPRTLAVVFLGKNSLDGDDVIFRTEENSRVWQCSFPFSPSAEPEAWCETVIAPGALVEGSDADGSGIFTGLTRGRLVYLTPGNHIVPDYKIRKNFGNGASAVYSIYRKEDSYIVIPKFTAPAHFDGETKAAIEECDYRYGISDLTLERMLSGTKGE